MQVSALGFGGVEIDGTSLADVEQLLGSALDAGINVLMPASSALPNNCFCSYTPSIYPDEVYTSKLFDDE